MNINMSMLEKKDIAIIIPYINLADYLLKLLKTINTKYSYQIYLIDNNSDQEKKKKLEHLKEFKYITLIENKTNLGVSSSWNLGVKKAVEDYDVKFAVVLNNDILLHPLCIDKMIRVSVGGSFLLTSGFDYCRELEVPEQILTVDIPHYTFIADKPEFSCYTLNIEMINKLIKVEEIFEDYPGLFDQKFYPAYFEDNDYHYRAKLARMRCVKTNSALYYHYGSRTINENPEMKAISDTFYLQNKQRYIEKWGGKPGKEKYLTPFDKTI